MFVNDAPACGLVGLSERPCRVRDVVVQQGQRIRSVVPQEALYQEGELTLSFRHVFEVYDEKPKILLTLSLHRGRWVGQGGA